MTRKAIVLVLIVFVLSSCATTKGILKKKDDRTDIAADQRKPVLPPPPPAKQVVKPPPRKLEPIRIEGVDDERHIILNFENTDIQTIISTFGELLGINYILTPGITGNVTVQTYKKFPVDNLFQIFQTLLEINGLTAVKDGAFYKIIPIDTVKQQPLEISKGKEMDFELDSTFVTQLIPLLNVKANETAGILRNLMPRGTDLIVYEPANMLIVTAKPQTLEKFMKIIEAMDISEAESESIRTFVYYVENGEATKLADLLKTVYSSDKKSSTPAATSTAAAPVTPRRTVTTPSRTTTPASETLPGELGDITLTAYEDINALIIKCNPRTYLSLLEVLKKIDIPPKQVLINVLMAEMEISDTSQFGLQWLTKTDRGDTFGFVSSDVESPPTITSIHPGSGDGIFAAVVSGVIDSVEYNYVFSAVTTATNSKVLANPQILAMDNKDAEITIGREVPTATSTTESEEGTTTTAQIEYKTVGTLLTVTPHITDKGNVSMKLVIERSDTSDTTALGSASSSYPSFTTNKATTTAVVKDGHTLVLAGMIEEKTESNRTGIPFLSKIPILGYLFGFSEDKPKRSELIVMVTPHVVNDQSAADELSSTYRERIKTIRKQINRKLPWDYNGEKKKKEKIDEKQPETPKEEEEQAAQEADVSDEGITPDEDMAADEETGSN